jgi:chlorobactene glucosyltransferase
MLASDGPLEFSRSITFAHAFGSGAPAPALTLLGIVAVDYLFGHYAVALAALLVIAIFILIKRLYISRPAGRADRTSVRMYTGWQSLWEGVAKNLVDMLGGPVPTLITALVGTALAWAAVLIPAADAIGCLQGRTYP